LRRSVALRSQQWPPRNYAALELGGCCYSSEWVVTIQAVPKPQRGFIAKPRVAQRTLGCELPLFPTPRALHPENPEEHHKQESFQDAPRRLLKKYGFERDERFVWGLTMQPRWAWLSPGIHTQGALRDLGLWDGTPFGVRAHAVPA